MNYSRSFGKLYTQLGLKYEFANYDYYAGGKLFDESSRTYHRIALSVFLLRAKQTFTYAEL